MEGFLSFQIIEIMWAKENDFKRAKSRWKSLEKVGGKRQSLEDFGWKKSSERKRLFGALWREVERVAYVGACGEYVLKCGRICVE